MKQIKKIVSMMLAVVMLAAMSITAFGAAENTGFSDVTDDAWYADAVKYVRDNRLMSGTGPAAFEPERAASREVLATALYRASGAPKDSPSADFSDVRADAYYTDAVNWAAARGIIIGYSDGRFGVGDPITREQMAVILWNFAGSPGAEAGQDFADESEIAIYAVTAVDWARANGIMNGKDGNLFDPKGSVTRAETASALYHYMTMTTDTSVKQENPAEPELSAEPGTAVESGKTLVVYFSGSGNTKSVAESIADALNADIFEITPTAPYTPDDLDWTDSASRVNAEHENLSLRKVALTKNTADNWDSYETVLIGYPIWWGIAAWPVNSFVEANDFTGKTVIPFCTSTSSGMGESGKLLAELAGNGQWLDGRRFSGRPSRESVTAWLEGLNLN